MAAAAQCLLDLVKPCRTAFIHWRAGNGSGKEVRPVDKSVTIHTVVRHLSPATRAGPNSIGFFLEQSGPAGFETSTLALDLDQHNPAGLRTLIDTLDACNIRAYTTRGSSGRGHHLYVFIDSPVPLPDAHKALLALREMATASGFDRVEIRPSNGRGRGIGLLAPYRGAGSDGLGFNPFTDPRASGAPIPVWGLSEVYRTPTGAIHALAKLAASRPVAEVQLPEPDINVPEPAAVQRWTAELNRVRSYWSETRRQDLTMGLAAFGCRGLKLDSETIRVDILRLAAGQSDEELHKRQVAIDTTFANYSAGRLVAWREYYDRAGLLPPTVSSGRPPPRALSLWHLTTVAKGNWRGRTGLTDMVVYAALVRRGLEHGRQANGNLLISVAVRDIQLDANIGAGTRQAAIKRLTARGLIARVDAFAKERTQAGAFVLRSPNDLGPHDEGESELDISELERFVDIVLHHAFRERALSRATGWLFAQLTLATDPLTRVDLAQVTALSSETVRKGVDKLLAHDLIEELSTGRLRARGDVLERLQQVADQVGATARRRQQEAEVEREREAFRELWPYLEARRKVRGRA